MISPWPILLDLSAWAWILLIFLAFITIVVTCLLAALLWAAKGSRDVNGDPERDSGLSDLEIERNARIRALQAKYAALEPPPRARPIRSAICDSRTATIADLLGFITISILFIFFCIAL